MKQLFAVLLLVTGIVAPPVATMAQTVVFSDDQEAYLQEISAMLISADKKEGSACIEKVFTPFWNSGFLGNEQRSRLVAISNVMAKKRFRPIPDFMDMLTTAPGPTFARMEKEKRNPNHPGEMGTDSGLK